MAKKDQDRSSFFKKLRNKYRLVILNDDTFEEKLSLKLSRLNVFLISGFAAIVLIGSTILLIAFTPLREYIPGYSSTALRRTAFELAIKSDSLHDQLTFNKRYLMNLRYIIEGRDPVDFSDTAYSDSIVEAELNQSISKNDSLLREFVEEEERFNLQSVKEAENKGRTMSFFTPLKGLITDHFDATEQHLGLDIVADENEVIKSVQDGIVVLANYTSETGYVLVLQHPNNFISVYKHNSALLKEQGALVKAGEPIAIIGNSGKLSSGPHLHFELWYKSFPVDPEDYISF